MTASFTSTKTYRNLPCAHRQWRHEGHCAWIHGYSRSFTFVFAADALDENHFVMDFGGLKKVKTWLEHMFDHTLLICADDPHLQTFEGLHDHGLCSLRVLPNVSMEATAKYVYEHVQPLIHKATGGRVWIQSVECRENDKNSAIYTAA